MLYKKPGASLVRIVGLLAVISVIVAASASAASAGSQSPVAYAKAQLAKYLNPLSKFTPPGAPLKHISKLKGATITFVPIFLESPYFGAEAAQLKIAASTVGAHLEVCNAGATPTGALTCFKQAVADHSKGIISDALPYDYAANAYAAAASAHIPVVANDINDQPPASLHGDAYTLTLNTNEAGRLVSDEIIAHSGGKANVLGVVSTYNSQATQNIAAMVNELKTHCPGCKYTQALYNEADQLSGISLDLDKDPSINYVIAQEDLPTGPVVAGVLQELNKSEKVISQSGQLYGLDRVKSGAQFADVGSDVAIPSWNAADLLFRMITKSTIPTLSKYIAPIRVFDASNIKKVSLTAGAFASGSWYSSLSFRAKYQKIWTS